MHRKHYTLQSFLRSEILYNRPELVSKASRDHTEG